MKEIAESSVLVVDDNETNVDILVDALGDFYDVSVAMDGLSALEAVDENPPDLILLDIMMPGMDGYEVCQRLKANKKTRNIPVIFVTAMVEVADEIKGFALGAVDYITKPISSPLVKARVETHLKLRNSEQRLKQLLEKTLGGAVGMLTDVLSISNPSAFGRASRVKRHVEQLAKRVNLSRFWQIRMAAMLSQIGCITVSPEILERIYRGEDVSFEEQDSFDRHPRVGYELLRKIPNLREVAEIVARQQNLEIDTGFKGSDEARKLVRVGSRILKLALDYENLVFRGDSSEAALSTLKSNEREYSAELLGQFSPIVQGESSHNPIRQLRASELSPGMIIHQDILTNKGKLLIEAGTEVSLPVYETLHNFTRTGFVQEPFQVLVPESV
jgi:putative two-component system response regulator